MSKSHFGSLRRSLHAPFPILNGNQSLVSSICIHPLCIMGASKATKKSRRSTTNGNDKETVNSIDDEWQTRRNKRLVQMAKYQMRWPFAFALALCLQTHGEWIELNRKAIKKVHNNGRMLLWPNPENRNVSKRMWNDQNIAAKHCLKSSAKLYFDFWAFCVQRESYIMG